MGRGNQSIHENFRSSLVYTSFTEEWGTNDLYHCCRLSSLKNGVQLTYVAVVCLVL